MIGIQEVIYLFTQMKSSTSVKTQAASLLKRLSIGKYHTKLYHKGETYSSSVIGGLFTLVMIVFMSGVAFYLLDNALSEDKKHYTIVQKPSNLLNNETKFHYFKDNLLNTCFQIFKASDSPQNCSDLQLSVVFQNRQKANTTQQTFRFSPLSGIIENLCELNCVESKDQESQDFRVFMMGQLEQGAIDYEIDKESMLIPLKFIFKNITQVESMGSLTLKFLNGNIFESGLYPQNRLINYRPLDCDTKKGQDFIQTSLAVMKYRSTESVFLTNFQETFIINSNFHTETLVCKREKIQETLDVEFSFSYNSPIMIEYVRTPDSIISVLSKIGGLLAVFKLSTFLFWWHMTSFEKKIASDLKLQKKPMPIEENINTLMGESMLITEQKTSQSVKEIFSFEEYIRMREEIEKLTDINEKWARRFEKIEKAINL
ncbi:hypothetical protein FGO68_gene12521 [Halteria grandinella]|uniref:Transmembrane protein n=1 Tax=Halteria grandinella TaxID=5974 RepID=A0A8J8NNG5_HALGN|nr:hypothetical protein FGO68_gene12521 [Halteria grandinella]